MFRRTEDSTGVSPSGNVDQRTAVVVAGPGSSLTIPGIVVSEIVRALAEAVPVTRIEVDLGIDFMSGLHRAPSLAAAHDSLPSENIVTYTASNSVRFRTQTFRELIGPNVRTAIAYAWPGIDNRWIKQYLQVANAAGAYKIVVCQSLPSSGEVRAVSLAEIMASADLVLVGNDVDASALVSSFGPMGPKVEVHRALALGGRDGRSKQHQITAFLPKDDCETLSTLLAAFDAIPEAWISAYRLQIVMRFSGDEIPDLVARSYHANFVTLVGQDFSTIDLEQLCSASSALIVADPAFDSRAFLIAVDCGIATVVLSPAKLPDVGRGYVGGLLADMNRPASVHVALIHALRLAELRFPSPDAWVELAQRLGATRSTVIAELGVLEPFIDVR